MANNFIDAVNMAQVIGTVFDGITVLPLRPKYVFDALAKEKEWQLNTSPKIGDAVIFPVLSALATNTSKLDATATGYNTGKKLVHTRKSVTLAPYGDYGVLDTLIMSNETFVNDVADASWAFTDQAMASLNLIAKEKFDSNKYRDGVSGALSGTYHAYGSYGFGASTLGPLKAKDVRAVVSSFRANNVAPFSDGLYRGVITPNQYTQLRADSSDASWTKSTASSSSEFALGEMGDFEGVRFIVNSANTGIGTNTVSSYFFGADFIGKAVGFDVKVSSGKTLVGPHENLLPIHWEALVGYGVIRRESGIIVESTSTNM